MSGLSNQSHDSQVSNSTASANSHDETQKVNGIQAELNERHEHEQEDEDEEEGYIEVFKENIHSLSTHWHICTFMHLSNQPILWQQHSA